METYNWINISRIKAIYLLLRAYYRFHIKLRFRYFFLSDRTYNRLIYKKVKGKYPNIKNPILFGEKLIYLKIHYRNPFATLCSDKYNVHEFVRACGYGNILKKVYAVTVDATKLKYEKLPEKFFMHCSHMSGFNYLVKKSDVKYPRLFGHFFNILLKANWYYQHREWNYKDINGKVICEEYLENSDGTPLVDYKFYCFSGEPKYFMISIGELEHKVKSHKLSMDMQSIDNHFKEKPTLPYSDITIPQNFDKMIEIVKALCAPFPHVRVDLLNIDGRIVFGELTFFSNGGFVNIIDENFESVIGSWIDLNRYSLDYV
jgi:hypothetical protein